MAEKRVKKHYEKMTALPSEGINNYKIERETNTYEMLAGIHKNHHYIISFQY